MNYEEVSVIQIKAIRKMNLKCMLTLLELFIKCCDSLVVIRRFTLPARTKNSIYGAVIRVKPTIKLLQMSEHS